MQVHFWVDYFSNQFHWPLGILEFGNHKFKQLQIENSVYASAAADSQLSIYNTLSLLWFVESGDAEGRLLGVKSSAQIFDCLCSVPRTPTLCKCQLCNKKGEVGHLWLISLLGKSAVTAELLNQWGEGHGGGDGDSRKWEPSVLWCVSHRDREQMGTMGEGRQWQTHPHLLPLDVSALGSHTCELRLVPTPLTPATGSQTLGFGLGLYHWLSWVSQLLMTDRGTHLLQSCRQHLIMYLSMYASRSHWLCFSEEPWLIRPPFTIGKRSVGCSELYLGIYNMAIHSRFSFPSQYFSDQVSLPVFTFFLGFKANLSPSCRMWRVVLGMQVSSVWDHYLLLKMLFSPAFTVTALLLLFYLLFFLLLRCLCWCLLLLPYPGSKWLHTLGLAPWLSFLLHLQYVPRYLICSPGWFKISPIC